MNEYPDNLPNPLIHHILSKQNCGGLTSISLYYNSSRSVGSVEATFHHQHDVTLTPSNVQIQFGSDAISMSGLDLKVPSSAYKISLLKKKVLSGRYESEISFE